MTYHTLNFTFVPPADTTISLKSIPARRSYKYCASGIVKRKHVPMVAINRKGTSPVAYLEMTLVFPTELSPNTKTLNVAETTTSFLAPRASTACSLLITATKKDIPITNALQRSVLFNTYSHSSFGLLQHSNHSLPRSLRSHNKQKKGYNHSATLIVIKSLPLRHLQLHVAGQREWHITRAVTAEFFFARRHMARNVQMVTAKGNCVSNHLDVVQRKQVQRVWV